MPPSGVTVYDFQVLQDIVGAATSCLYIEYYDHFREQLLSKNQSPFGHFLFLMKVAYNRLNYSLISLPYISLGRNILPCPISSGLGHVT